jgi:hypothetical protein
MLRPSPSKPLVLIGALWMGIYGPYGPIPQALAQESPSLQEVILEPGTTSVLAPGTRTRVTCVEEAGADTGIDEVRTSQAAPEAGVGNAPMYWLCECTRPGYPRLVRKLMTSDGRIVQKEELRDFVQLGSEANLREKCERARLDTPGCAGGSKLTQATR